MAEGGGTGPEVRVRLVVDSNSREKTEELKRGLHEGNEELEKGQKHSEHLGHELLKASLYTELAKKGAEVFAEGMHAAYESAEQLAGAAMEAADESNQQVRAMTGLMSLMDRGEHQMGEIRDYARDVREELAKMGTQAGVATGDMEAMYEKVIERGNRSTESAKELVGQMAIVGKVVPQGMEGLAQGFNMMELGIVRARNPLVQLISSTGVLKGTAHDVAEQMKKMTPAEQIEKATLAIEKQAEAMKKGGAAGLGAPTMGELKASFGNLREGFMEAMGQPLLDKLVPQLVRLRDFLSENAEKINAFGADVGKKLGAVVDTVSSLVGDVYSGIVRDWDSIRDIYQEAINDWKDVWALLGVQSSDIHKNFTDVGKTLVAAFKTISDYIKAYFEVGAGLLDLAHGKAYGTTANAARVDQLGKRVTEGADTYGAGSGAALDETIAKYRDAAQMAGMSAEATDKWVEAMRDHHEQALAEASTLKDKTEGQDFDYVSRYLQQAMSAGNDAAEAAALNIIGGSDSAARALMTGAIHVEGGLAALQSVIDDRAPELAKKLKAFGNSLTGVGIKGQGPSVVFNGTTINIKQDFRDEDPDRVMAVFRRDLGNAAVARRQARTASAYGL